MWPLIHRQGLYIIAIAIVISNVSDSPFAMLIILLLLIVGMYCLCHTGE